VLSASSATTAPITGKLNAVISSGVFQNEVVTGATTGETLTVTSITVPTYVVDVSQIWYSVSGTAVVGLQWGNSTPAFASFAMLAGTGALTKNVMPGRFAPSAFVAALPNPNGNIYLSTYGVAAKGTYHIILDLHKQAGFSQRPVY
jgi:hypothetical protein